MVNSPTYVLGNTMDVFRWLPKLSSAVGCLVLLLACSHDAKGQQVNCVAQQVILIEDGVCNYDPYVLVFEDEFNSNGLDLSSWQYSQDYQGRLIGATSQEYYAPENVVVANALLSIAVDDEPVVRRARSWQPDGMIMSDGSPNLRTYNYTAGYIETPRTFYHGIFEIRCKIPKGKSFWPAFWTYAEPPWTEIDVFEFRNEYIGPEEWGIYDPTQLSRVHSMDAHVDLNGDGNTSGEHCASEYNGPDFSQAFHTFSVVWTPYVMKWYMDGNLKRSTTRFRTLLPQDLDCNSVNAWQPLLMEKVYPNKAGRIIVSIGIQSGVNGPDGDTPFPSQFEVDYVRYYRQMACPGALVITQSSGLALNSEQFNARVGSTITLGGAVTVQNSDQIEFIAGESIQFNPGFEAVAGAHVHAHIRPGMCGGGMVGESNGMTLDGEEILAHSSEVKSIGSEPSRPSTVDVMPNPSSGAFRLAVDLGSDIGTYNCRIVDGRGAVVFEQNDLSNGYTDVDISGLGTGVYLLRLVLPTGVQIATRRVVVQ